MATLHECLYENMELAQETHDSANALKHTKPSETITFAKHGHDERNQQSEPAVDMCIVFAVRRA